MYRFNLSMAGEAIQKAEFKYNKCIGSMLEMRGIDQKQFNLNTTNVSVQWSMSLRAGFSS